MDKVCCCLPIEPARYQTLSNPIKKTHGVNEQLTQMSTIIKMNIGSAKYTTTRTTLESTNSTLFTGLLSGGIHSAKDEEGSICMQQIWQRTGAYFVDRDGAVFGVILEYLRHGELRLGEIAADRVLREADFYCTQDEAYVLLYHSKSAFQVWWVCWVMSRSCDSMVVISPRPWRSVLSLCYQLIDVYNRRMKAVALLWGCWMHYMLL